MRFPSAVAAVKSRCRLEISAADKLIVLHARFFDGTGGGDDGVTVLRGGVDGGVVSYMFSQSDSFHLKCRKNHNFAKKSTTKLKPELSHPVMPCGTSTGWSSKN